MLTRKGPRVKRQLPPRFLSRLREAADATQLELAADAEVSLSTIVRAERSGLVTADVANAIGAALSTQFGFQIDVDDPDEVRRIDALLRDGRRPAPSVESAWPLIISTDVEPDRTIVGRAELVADLGNLLGNSPGKGDQRIAVLQGAPGIGKSSVARELIRLHRPDFAGIWWCRAQTRLTLVQDLCQLADRLGLKPWDYDGPDDRAKAAVARASGLNQCWLLVLDNAHSPRLILEFLPRRANLRCLVTTREAGWPQRQFDERPVPKLAPGSARSLLSQEAERPESDIDGIDELISDHLDGLPLMIVHAGIWLRAASASSGRDYAASLTRHIRTRPMGVYDYPDHIYGAIMLSVEALSPLSRSFAEILAYLSPDRLTPALFAAIENRAHVNGAFAALPQACLEYASDRTLLPTMFDELRRRGILDRTGEQYSMHRVTQLVIRESLDANLGEITGKAAASILCRCYPPASEVYSFPPVLAQLADHARSIVQHVPASAEVGKLCALAWYALDFERDDAAALEYGGKAVALSDRFLEPGAFDRGVAYSNLGVTQWRLGNLDVAEQLTSISSAMGAKAQPKVVDHGMWISVHGMVLFAAARRAEGERRATLFARAATAQQQTLVIFRGIFHGSNSRHIATCLTHLGAVRAFQARWSAALRLLLYGLRIRLAVLSPGDPDLAYSYVNTGIMMLNGGRAADDCNGMNAIDLLEKGLAIREAAFADRPLHPERLAAARWLIRAHVVLFEVALVRGISRSCLKRALGLAGTYGLDISSIHASAAAFAARIEQFRAGEKVPAMLMHSDE